jgi:hypothetical protein
MGIRRVTIKRRMYAVYVWNLFFSMLRRIAVLVYVKNVGTWAMWKVSNEARTYNIYYLLGSMARYG